MKSLRLPFRLALCLAVFSLCSAALAQEEDWPREIRSGDTSILIYEPQPESLSGDHLIARAAVSVTTGGAEPVYGTTWFSSYVATDRDSRTATMTDVVVTKSVFPTAAPDAIDRYADLVGREMTRWNLSISLDTLLTGLESAGNEPAAAAEGLNVAPPRIIFAPYPAVLVTIDGKPELRTVGQSRFMRVVNSPFLIALDMDARTYYLYGGGLWYGADDVMGPWQPVRDVPSEVTDLAAGPQPAGAFPAAAPLREAPRVIVSAEPAELISSDGEPAYSPADPEGELLYMSNTDSDVFLEIASQRHFVLLSGRWFSGESLQGPWEYCPGDDLPASFARIPTDSVRARVLASVPGTPAAQEAAVDAGIPQTAVVRRADARLDVEYDGNPVFRRIEGTRLDFAVNTSFAVVRAERRYYCCHQAVWYVARAPLGPWVCADSVPVVIYTIPPTCPIYRVRFAYIYRVTPELIYCGYTPGYEGCYVYRGTVVYGTGYHYPPYIGRVYCYPRPATWGFRACYDGAEGDWGFSLGIATRFLDFDVSFARGWDGWWGPGGCRIRDFDSRRRIYVTRNADVFRNVYIRPERVRPVIYDRPENQRRGARVVRARDVKLPEIASGKSNDVFADRNGNIYRRSDQGWRKLDRAGWSAPEPLPRAAERAREAEGAPAAPPLTEERGRGATTREKRGPVTTAPEETGGAPAVERRTKAERVTEPAPQAAEERTPAARPQERGRTVTAPEETRRVTGVPEETGRTAAPGAKGRTTATEKRERAAPPERPGRAEAVEQPKPGETSTQQLEREFNARERGKQRAETFKQRSRAPAEKEAAPSAPARQTKEAAPRESDRGARDTKGGGRQNPPEDNKRDAQ